MDTGSILLRFTFLSEGVTSTETSHGLLVRDGGGGGGGGGGHPC